MLLLLITMPSSRGISNLKSSSIDSTPELLHDREKHQVFDSGVHDAMLLPRWTDVAYSGHQMLLDAFAYCDPRPRNDEVDVVAVLLEMFAYRRTRLKSASDDPAVIIVVHLGEHQTFSSVHPFDAQVVYRIEIYEHLRSQSVL